MPSSTHEYFISVVIILLMLFVYIFRKWISYLWCPLEKYEGHNYGKSHYLFMFHIIFTAFIAISLFIKISRISFIDPYFENHHFVRIASFVCIYLFFFLVIGFGIDQYLIRTDLEFKQWKKKKFKMK